MRYGQELRLRLELLRLQVDSFMGLAGTFAQSFPTMQNPMYNTCDRTRIIISSLEAQLDEHEFNFGTVEHEMILDEYSLIRKVKELTKDDSIVLSDIVWMENIESEQVLQEGQVSLITRRLAWLLDDVVKFERPGVEFAYHPNYGIEQTSVMSIPSMNVDIRRRAARGVQLRIGRDDFISEINKVTGLQLTYEEWIAVDEQSVRDDWMRCAPKSLSKIRMKLFDHYKDKEYSLDNDERAFFRKCDYINNDMCRTISGWPTSKHEDRYHSARSDYRRYYFKLKEIGLEDLWEDVEITEPPTQETHDAS